MRNFISHKMPLRNRQRGVSTLAITILLLVIITLVVLFSTSVGFIEQRTALNENRARIAEQAAEAGINMAGEYIKASRDLIISRSTNGWLDTVAGGAGWVTCRSKAATFAGGEPHPCMSEADPDRRAEMFFYTTDGVGASAATTYLPYGAINTVGAAGFASTVNVQAVLCRIDTTLVTPTCRELPLGGNRITVTLISSATLTDENANAVIKETWASFSTSAFSSAVPLATAGIVKGLGNSMIVASPNAGGFGVAASMWSPNNIGFGTKIANSCTDGSTSGAGGLGSSSTCHIEDYLFGTTVEPSNIKIGCAANGANCGCPTDDGRYLSGHVGSDKAEGIDILDVDKIPGDPDYSDGFGPLPDITFYPGSDCNGNPMDSDSDGLDDSLFEWIFGVDVVNEGTATTKNTLSVRQNCGPSSNQDCAVYALTNDLGAASFTCDALNILGPAASGLYYVTDPGGCTFASQIGSATQSVVVVVEQVADIRNNFFGLLFVRSKNNTANVNISGNNKLFGGMAVEGDIDVTGSFHIVYEDVSVSSDPFTFPKSARFARVPGSWLDATTGF
jgi:hypothetical protein